MGGLAILGVVGILQWHGHQTAPLRKLHRQQRQEQLSLPSHIDVDTTQSSEDSPSYYQAQKAGLWASRTKGLLSAALFWDGSVKALVALHQYATSPFLMVFELSSVPTSWTLARLLWNLRRADLQTLSAAMQAQHIEDIFLDTRSQLFAAQAKFYGEAKGVFQSDALTKVGLGVFSLLRVWVL